MLRRSVALCMAVVGGSALPFAGELRAEILAGPVPMARRVGEAKVAVLDDQARVDSEGSNAKWEVGKDGRTTVMLHGVVPKSAIRPESTVEYALAKIISDKKRDVGLADLEGTSKNSATTRGRTKAR
jgi:hypothetical protein